MNHTNMNCVNLNHSNRNHTNPNYLNRNHSKGNHYIIMFTIGFLLVGLLGVSGCGGFGANTANIDAGMTAVEALDYDGALACFADAAAAGEDERLLYRGIGLSHMGKTEYSEAITAFQAALSHSNGIPDNIDYDINYYMAVAYYKTGQKAEAVAAYDAILALREDDGDAYYLRGAIQAEQGNLEAAKADFDKTLSLDKNTDRLIEIYGILNDNGYKEVGQEYLHAAMDDTNKMTEYEKGRICYYLGNYEDAKTYLEEARDESYEAVLFLGRTYEALGDNNYAISVYNAYLEAGNESPHVYNQLGICKLKLKEYDAALAAFQAGMKIEENPILQTLRFNEIITYEYLGEYKKASVLMAGYLQTYPDDALAARENIFLETR